MNDHQELICNVRFESLYYKKVMQFKKYYLMSTVLLLLLNCFLTTGTLNSLFLLMDVKEPLIDILTLTVPK